MVSPVLLVRFNPDSPREVAELRRQRVLCGWGGPHIENWIRQVRAGDKNLFWITPGSETFTIPEKEPFSLDPGRAGPPPPDPSFQPIGHASLDWCETHNNPTLADRASGIVTFATFFILASQQGRGLGRIVMDEFEALASSPEFNAKLITINTLPAACAAAAEFWKSVDLPYNPSARINEHWYQRRGYITYDLEPRYFVEKRTDGSELVFPAVYMKKECTPAKGDA